MGCFKPQEIESGKQVFMDSYRATGNFYQSSLNAVEHLNAKGVKITQNEFDIIAHESFYDFVSHDVSVKTGVQNRIDIALDKINKNLGIVGKYKPELKGQYLSGNFAPHVHERLDLIAQELYGNTKGQIGPADKMIVKLIKDGETQRDPEMLEQALKEIRQIQKTGKSTIETLMEADQKEISRKANELAKDFSRLSIKQQKLRATALAVNKGEGDVDLMRAEAKDLGMTFNPDLTDAEIAKVILKEMSKLSKHAFHKTWAARASKLYGDLFVQTSRDLNTIIHFLSKRGGTRLNEGIAQTELHNEMRIADSKNSELKQKYINKLGGLIAKAYGVKVPPFKGNMARVAEVEFYSDLFEDFAMESTKEIDTGIYPEGLNGHELVLQKGELMQLYAHSRNGYLMEAMERTGLTRGQLKGLVEQHLTEQDKLFTMSTINEFNRDLYNDENFFHERNLYTKMKNDQNYSGNAVYQGDAEVQQSWFGSEVQHMDTVTDTLQNSKAKTAKALDLNVNLFSNIKERAFQSAKFQSGYRVHKILRKTLDTPLVKSTLKDAHLLDYNKILKNRLDEHFAVSKKLGKIPDFITMLKGNWVMAKLGIKPKIGLNQMASSVNWLAEQDTLDGIAQDRHPDLKGINMTKLIFDNSADIVERYKNENIVALDADIQASKNEVKLLRKIMGSRGKNVKKKAKAMVAWNLKTGDRIGIISLGKFYIQGSYNKFRAEGMSHDIALKRSIAKFNKHYQLTQQSYLSIDKSPLQNNPYGSLMTMFGNTPYQYQRKTLQAAVQMYRQARGQEHKGTFASNLGQVFVYHFAAGALYHLITVVLPHILLTGEIEEEDLWELLWSGLRGPYIDRVFIIGTYVNNIYNFATDSKFRSEVFEVPLAQIFNKIGRLGESYWKLANKDDRTDAENERMDEIETQLMAEFASLFGIPVDGARQIFNGVGGLLDGDIDAEDIVRLGGWSEYTIEQSKPKEEEATGVFSKKNKSVFNKKGKSVFDQSGKSVFDK